MTKTLMKMRYKMYTAQDKDSYSKKNLQKTIKKNYFALYSCSAFFMEDGILEEDEEGVNT